MSHAAWAPCDPRPAPRELTWTRWCVVLIHPCTPSDHAGPPAPASADPMRTVRELDNRVLLAARAIHAFEGGRDALGMKLLYEAVEGWTKTP